LSLLRICALALSCFCFQTEGAAAQVVDPPRTIAFVVGVQSYDDPDLNKLQYTARDAQDVFERLQTVANLDLERSRLLLADPSAPEERDPSDPAWLIRKTRLAQQELHDELAGFLESVKDEDTVAIYLGGHGTVQARSHLLFLPSDYSRRPQRRFLRYNTIMDDIRGRIDDRNLRNVRVVFFANMCGAGTAAGAMDAEQDLHADFVRDWLRENTLGFERFAFFPASAPNQNTFESTELGRSIFAHHLLEGLRGGAAQDGVITSASLFDYLDENVPEDLPRDPETFDPTIRIGVTREIEARALYHLGLTLVAEALETNDPLFWRLAERDFAEAMEFSGGGEIGAAAALRLAQVRAVNFADPAELGRLLERATIWAIDSDMRAAAESLLEAANDSIVVPFAALVLTDRLPSEKVDRWLEFLERLPGRTTTQLAVLDLGAKEAERWQQALQVVMAVKRDSRVDDGVPHLVLVYSGRAGLVEGRMSPLPIDAYVALVNQWGGEVTIIYDAPFGGFLKEAYDGGLFGDVSLVLSAREKHGMTFGPQTGESPTTNLLINMLESGVVDPTAWEPFAEYAAALRSIRFSSLSALERDLYGAEMWTIGTPAFFQSTRSDTPIVSRVAELRRRASVALTPIRRVASLLATGCDLSRDPECERIAPGALEIAAEEDLSRALELPIEEGRDETQAIYDLLKEAARLDFKGDLSEAFAGYYRFIEAHQLLHRDARSEDVAGNDARTAAQRSLKRATEQVRNRITGLEGKLVRQFRLLLASVPDYSSPLVPDLVGTIDDLAGWEAELQDLAVWRTLQAAAGESDLHVVHLDTASREALLASFEGAMNEAADEDLVFFVYSGRGIEVGGERYLAPADVFSVAPEAAAEELQLALLQARMSTHTTPSLGMSPVIGSPFGRFEVEELVSLAEIADRARDHWFVGIYDTQFSQPVFEPGRADSVLDKHLHSVRPVATQAPSLPAAEMERFLPASPEAPAHHVHIWWEGRLTERLDADLGCVGEAPHEIRGFGAPVAGPEPAVRSPMSAALIASLKEQPHETYRSWVERALVHPCLGAPTGFGLVAQGSVDLPRFASGTAATLIQFFLGAGERRDANLQLAEQLARAASRSGDHPLTGLTLAAIVVARAEFERSALFPNGGPKDELKEAIGLLGRMLTSRRVAEAGLNTEALDLYTRALMLSGDQDLARTSLLDAPAAQLAAPALQERLVDLTEAQLAQSPTDILALTRAKLVDLGRVGTEPSVDISARLEALASAFADVHRQYRMP
jgi:uncharacterized caspase-like protein